MRRCTCASSKCVGNCDESVSTPRPEDAWVRISGRHLIDLESRLTAAEKRLKWQSGMLERARKMITTAWEGCFDEVDQWLSDLEKGPVK